MKRIIAVVAFVLACASPVTAQTTVGSFGGTTLQLGSMPVAGISIPPVPCVNGVGPSGGWNECNSIQQWTQMYNEYTTLVNQLTQIHNSLTQLATYPTTMQGNITSDFSTIGSIVNQTNGLSVTDQQIQSTATRLFPGYSGGQNYADLVHTLNTNTNVSINNALATAGYNMSTMPRDADDVETIKAAAANAQNPTQAVQALAQLDAVMLEQIMKEQQLIAASLQASSAYYMSRMTLSDASGSNDQNAFQAWQQFLDTSMPTITPTQAASLIRNANPNP